MGEGSGAMLARHDEQFVALARSLPEQDWQRPSLCAGWTNRDVLAHVVLGCEMPVSRLLSRIVGSRGSFHRANDQLSRERGRDAEPARLIEEFDVVRQRHRGAGRLMPARFMLGDHVVHLLDIALPLGLQTAIPAGTARAVLATEANVPNPVVPSQWRARGLSLRATDIDWARPAKGPQVSGQAAHLISVLAGRPHALASLDGDGVSILRSRVEKAAPTPG
jgi:uncharacterized protein (TIGR03083 family)